MNSLIDVFVVLRSCDNEEDGTFTLYCFSCRHAKIDLLLNGQVANEEFLNYKLEIPLEENYRSRMKDVFEKHKTL